MSNSPFQRFVSELRRRHVPQTAAVYLVAAWAAIEFSDVVVPNLNGPQWIVTAVIVAAAVGFPVVLVLAWMFDWGPEGVVRTPDDAEGGSVGTPTGPSRATPWLTTIAVLVVGIGSAVAVAALLTGEGEGSSPGSDPGRSATGAGAGAGEGAPPEAIAPPPSPGLADVDSLAGALLRGLEEGGWENFARLQELEALGRMGARGAGDSTRHSIRELAREVAVEADLSVVIREPRQWRIGSGVPASVAVGDTLVISGVAVDTAVAGVVAVTVDGETVVELEEARPSVLFEARIVGRPVVGLRDVPIVVRTADGRELRTVFSVLTPTPPGGGG